MCDKCKKESLNSNIFTLKYSQVYTQKMAFQILNSNIFALK